MAMRTGASDVSSRGFRGQIRPDARLKKNRKSRLRRSALESLEARTLLAVLPPAQYASGLITIPGGGGNDSTSTVAIDRYKPLHLASAGFELTDFGTRQSDARRGRLFE